MHLHRVDSTGELLLPLLAADTGPAREWADAARTDRVAPPHELVEGDAHLNVTRTFCFADLSGFTAFTRDNGPHAAVGLLGQFQGSGGNSGLSTLGLCGGVSSGGFGSA